MWAALPCPAAALASEGLVLPGVRPCEVRLAEELPTARRVRQLGPPDPRPCAVLVPRTVQRAWEVGSRLQGQRGEHVGDGQGLTESMHIPPTNASDHVFCF